MKLVLKKDVIKKKYSIKAGENSSDNIRKLYNKLNSDSVVYDVKITVSQGKNKLTKVVAITKDNFVRNKVDLNNSQVTKVEYRPIEGFARKMFGETGTPEEIDETYLPYLQKYFKMDEIPWPTKIIYVLKKTKNK